MLNFGIIHNCVEAVDSDLFLYCNYYNIINDQSFRNILYYRYFKYASQKLIWLKVSNMIQESSTYDHDAI